MYDDVGKEENVTMLVFCESRMIISMNYMFHILASIGKSVSYTHYVLPNFSHILL